MRKIDEEEYRELLRDIGFIRGTGDWGHEVWVYEGYFWVHFTETMIAEHRQRWPEAENTVYVPRCSRKEFFKLFLDVVRNEIWESAQVHEFED